MDPQTGRIYSPEEIEGLPDDVKARIVPIDDRSLFQQELEELKVLQKLYEEGKAQNDALEATQEEKFYPVNRQARRKQAKRDRALQKRDLRG